MVTNEPMTDEQLDDIDEMLHDGDELPHDVAVRLANEVDRLRAREQALAAENAAMRPIVEAVAIGSVIATGSANTRITGPVLFNAFADMPALHEQARAFIAAHPTAAGEAEREGE